jgi:hypothetical protein
MFIDGKAVDIYEVTPEVLRDMKKLEDDGNVVTYDDLIEDQELALEIALLSDDPYSDLWSDLIDKHGEAKLMAMGADV